MKTRRLPAWTVWLSMLLTSLGPPIEAKEKPVVDTKRDQVTLSATTVEQSRDAKPRPGALRVLAARDGHSKGALFVSGARAGEIGTRSARWVHFKRLVASGALLANATLESAAAVQEHQLNFNKLEKMMSVIQQNFDRLEGAHFTNQAKFEEVEKVMAQAKGSMPPPASGGTSDPSPASVEARLQEIEGKCHCGDVDLLMSQVAEHHEAIQELRRGSARGLDGASACFFRGGSGRAPRPPGGSLGEVPKNA